MLPPVWPVVLAGFTAFLGLYAPQPLLPLLMRVFDATPLAVSLTVTATTMGVALAAPFVGLFADVAGRKRVIVGSAVLLAVATGLAATAATLGQLIAWRFLQGVLTPGVFAITIAYIHERWPASHSGRATAAYVSGTVVGGFCGRATAGVVATLASWQAAFVVLALVTLAAALALSRWLPAEQSLSRVSGAGRPAASLARLLKNRQLLATNGVGFCVLFTLVAMFTYVTFYLSDPPFALNPLALGWLFVVYLFGAAVTPLAGRWTDRLGHRAALAGGVGIGIAGALMTLLPWLAAIVLGLALAATGVFIAQATASSYIGAVTAQDRGLAVGLYSTCYYAGGSVGGALPAVMWNVGGWPATVVLVLAVQVSTYALAMMFWTGTRGRLEAPLPDAGG
jgi:MFS transporter, YNFM family, putative membrane transport protein